MSSRGQPAGEDGLAKGIVKPSSRRRSGQPRGQRQLESRGPLGHLSGTSTVTKMDLRNKSSCRYSPAEGSGHETAPKPHCSTLDWRSRWTFVSITRKQLLACTV